MIYHSHLPVARKAYKKNRHSYRFFLFKKIGFFFVIFGLPFYPLIATFGSNEDQGGGYFNYDASTIIESLSGEAFEETFTNAKGFLEPVEIISQTRDLRGVRSILEYAVNEGDSLNSLSQKFGITQESIYWINSLTTTTLHVGQKLYIPPVSGLIHTVEAGETLESIAKKYTIDRDLIQHQNTITNSELTPGISLIIPGIQKNIPRSPVLTYGNQQGGYSFANDTSEVIPGDQYILTLLSNGRNFVWGNCTWFVAKYKNVTWRGNAKEWLKNAAKAGVPTGSDPVIGSIVVFHGQGYNPYYGHVGIVVDLETENIIIKDMNFRRLNEVTTRRVPKNQPAIIGYIYIED